MRQHAIVDSGADPQGRGSHLGVRGERFEYIDHLYAFGILLVVAGHSIEPGSAFQATLDSWIFSFHMPLFFFLSGFVSHQRSARFKDYVRKRAGRLLIPYLLVNVAWSLPKLALARYAIDPLQIDTMFRFLLYPWSSTTVVLWFLPVLFIINVLGLWAYEATAARSWWWRLALLAALGAVKVLKPFGDSDLLGASSVVRFAFFYWLGHVAFLSRHRLLAGTRLARWSVALALLFCHWAAWSWGGPVILVESLGIGMSLFWAVIVRPTGRLWRWLSHHSFQLYLFSPAGQAPARIVFRQFFHCTPGVTAAMKFAGGLIVPALIVATIPRWLPRIGMLFGMTPARPIRLDSSATN